MLSKLVLRLVLGLLSVPVLAASPAGTNPWVALKNGGILLVRHANAPGGGDPPGFNLNECATQRNLDTIGQRQATNIGARFEAEKIKPTAVFSSQWCRCKETAARAFPNLAQDAPAFNSFFQTPEAGQKQTKAAQKVLLTWAAKNRGMGTLVVVTHQVNITQLTGVVPAPGEGVVLAFDGKKLNVVGSIIF